MHLKLGKAVQKPQFSGIKTRIFRLLLSLLALIGKCVRSSRINESETCKLAEICRYRIFLVYIIMLSVSWRFENIATISFYRLLPGLATLRVIQMSECLQFPRYWISGDIRTHSLHWRDRRIKCQQNISVS